MATITQNKPVTFRHHVLSTLKSGVKNESRFEDLASSLLSNVSNQLLLIEDYDHRRNAVMQALKELEEAKLIRRYNMMHESPQFNKKLTAALTHVSNQFKLQFSRYI